MSKLFEHLNEAGLVIQNEIVHDIDTIEGWMSSRFGSVPLRDGHNIRMTDRETNEVEHHLPIDQSAAPQVEVPQVEAPQVEAPQVEAPQDGNDRAA